MRKIHIAVLASLVLFQTYLPCTASPIECASKRQRDVPLWFYVAYPIGEILYQYDFRFGSHKYFTINYPMIGVDLKSLTERKVSVLVLSEGAEASVLTNTKVFKHLQSCTLMDQPNTLEHLENLKSYGLKCLRIVQPKPLSEDCVRALSELDVKELILDCDLACPESFAKVVLKNLKILIVRGPVDLPDLPRLEKLSISRTRIDRAFWQNLKAPKLKEINLDYVDLESGAIAEISKFKNLRDFYLMDTSMSSGDPEFLRQNKKLIYRSSYHKKSLIHFGQIAEQSFAEEKYSQALENFLQTVFAEPSKNGYEKLAACYEKLGCEKLVIHYRKIAGRFTITYQ